MVVGEGIVCFHSEPSVNSRPVVHDAHLTNVQGPNFWLLYSQSSIYLLILVVQVESRHTEVIEDNWNKFIFKALGSIGLICWKN